MAVYATPDLAFGSVISGFFYSFWNLFAGFLIPVTVSNAFASISHAALLFSNPVHGLSQGVSAPSDVWHAWAQEMPRYWFWYYYLDPISWTLYGIIVTQLGDQVDVVCFLHNPLPRSHVHSCVLNPFCMIDTMLNLSIL